MFLKVRAFFPSGSQFESIWRCVHGGKHLIFCNYTQSELTEVCKRVRILKNVLQPKYLSCQEHKQMHHPELLNSLASGELEKTWKQIRCQVSLHIYKACIIQANGFAI